jgi:Cu/Ag efflux protein CusF
MLVMATASWSLHAQSPAKKEYEFRGTVEKVDTKAQKVTVNGENVEGWMKAMTMNYKVDRPDDVLKKLKRGDRIVARVVDGDFETLYDVKQVDSAGKDTDKGK